jgi:C_GCAxxG_C_C family probable redox protein
LSSINSFVSNIGKKACRNDEYGGCSQAVLAALFEGFHIGNTEILKSATALPGGGGWRGETCGALLGALMAVGTVIGRDNLSHVELYRTAMDQSCYMIQEFKDCLKQRFNFQEVLTSTLCWDIQAHIFGRSYDLSKQTERQAFIDAGGRSYTGCGSTCAVAAEVAARQLIRILPAEKYL